MTKVTNNIDFSENNVLISFEGVAWGCGFYIGVYKALIDRYGYEKIKKLKFAGTSSGALTACVCCLGIKWEILYDYYKTLSDVCEKYGPFGKVSIYYHFIIKYLFDSSPTIYQTLNNRLFIGVTRFFNKNETINYWNSNQEVIDTLNGSMNIPIYCTYIPNVADINIIDGAISKSFIIDNKINTITVSYIDKYADISGHDEFKLKDLYTAMSIKRLDFILELGYHRTRAFFETIDSSSSNNVIIYNNPTSSTNLLNLPTIINTPNFNDIFLSQHYINITKLNKKKYNNFIVFIMWLMFLIAKLKKYSFYHLYKEIISIISILYFFRFIFRKIKLITTTRFLLT